MGRFSGILRGEDMAMVTVGWVRVEGGATARKALLCGNARKSQTVGNLLCE